MRECVKNTMGLFMVSGLSFYADIEFIDEPFVVGRRKPGRSIHRFLPVVRKVRTLSTQSQFVVDKALLSKLRKKTGFPVINCRNALEQFDNDIKEAETWMREQAQKEGWAKASKLMDRPMSQGLVGLVQDETGVTIVEVNCETDFVAKNEKFQDLVSLITETCHKTFLTQDLSRVDAGKDELNALTEDGKSMSDHVALTVGKLGENIAIRRATTVKKEPDTVMAFYSHAAGPALVRGRCQLGKFASIVKIAPPDLQTVATQLCQHVIGMKPTEIGEWNLPPPEKKKKKDKKGAEEKKEEEGLGSKLLDQEFLLEPKFSVRGFLQDNGPRVVEFVRLECGEDLGEEV